MKNTVVFINNIITW